MPYEIRRVACGKREAEKIRCRTALFRCFCIMYNYIRSAMLVIYKAGKW